MDVSRDATCSSLADLRDVPIEDIAAALPPELVSLVQRIMPQAADLQRPPVSAFNSSI